MNDYWVKHFNDSVDLFPDSPLKQVGKTVNGREVGDDQVQIWVNSITENLDISNNDVVADLCCGNGLLTQRIAPYCHEIIGVDFADNLIRYAKQHSTLDNIHYETGNVSQLRGDFFSGVTKVYMYEAIQHLSTTEFEALLEHIHSSSSVNRFFIGGIPDSDRFEYFYDTEEKLAFERSRRESGQPHIGTWWNKTELINVIVEHGMTAKVIDQLPEQYCSHFRFDCLITR